MTRRTTDKRGEAEGEEAMTRRTTDKPKKKRTNLHAGPPGDLKPQAWGKIRLAVDIGRVVVGPNGPHVAGSSFPISQVVDVHRRLGLVRAMERFFLRESDVLSAVAFYEGARYGRETRVITPKELRQMRRMLQRNTRGMGK